MVSPSVTETTWPTTLALNRLPDSAQKAMTRKSALSVLHPRDEAAMRQEVANLVRRSSDNPAYCTLLTRGFQVCHDHSEPIVRNPLDVYGIPRFRVTWLPNDPRQDVKEDSLPGRHAQCFPHTG